MKRSARLFALAEALRARRTGVTAEELAGELGVSVRTVYRDLDTLREASLPVSAERGRGGGYALDRAYSLPPVNFTAREAMVLTVLGRLATDLRLFPFTSTLGRALDKVKGALPVRAQRELEAKRHRLTFTGVPAQESRAEVRLALEDAWFEEQPLLVSYRRADGSRGERTARVEGVVLERTTTLVNLEDVATKERRQLRLHQIETAVPVRGEPPPPITRGTGTSRLRRARGA